MQARSFMHVKFSEIHLFLFASREKNPVSQERKKKHLMDDKNKIKQEEKRDIAEKRVSCRLLLCCPARWSELQKCSTLLNKEPSQTPVYSAGSAAVT